MIGRDGLTYLSCSGDTELLSGLLTCEGIFKDPGSWDRIGVADEVRTLFGELCCDARLGGDRLRRGDF